MDLKTAVTLTCFATAMVVFSGMFLVYACCRVAGRCSREEEKRDAQSS